ncbi:MAG: Ribosomal small subunit methyltransferase [Armatimonadetes bacterium]|jgi:16S rRNA (uracil1498-N3)-methyltransferase|nr:Ribosomal small subunit methyltransferase [Armatimonadota bacterium]
MSDLPFPYSPLQHPHRLTIAHKIELDAQQAAALRFRQVNVSEAFTLQGPDGRFFRASLQGLGGKGGEALVYEEMGRSPESPLSLTLVCAVLARQRMLLVVPKVTELGVTRIQPVVTAHSVQEAGLEHEKASAWPNAAIRAARQCRRASIPEVRAAEPLAALLESDVWRQPRARFYLDDRAPQSARLERGPQSVALAVGPEGGWSDEERDLLQRSGAAPLIIGGRVLRAETAAITGVFLVQHALGDLGGE